jgi:hypothetical protein
MAPIRFTLLLLTLLSAGVLHVALAAAPDSTGLPVRRLSSQPYIPVIKPSVPGLVAGAELTLSRRTCPGAPKGICSVPNPVRWGTRGESGWNERMERLFWPYSDRHWMVSCAECPWAVLRDEWDSLPGRPNWEVVQALPLGDRLVATYRKVGDPRRLALAMRFARVQGLPSNMGEEERLGEEESLLLKLLASAKDSIAPGDLLERKELWYLVARLRILRSQTPDALEALDSSLAVQTGDRQGAARELEELVLWVRDRVRAGEALGSTGFSEVRLRHHDALVARHPALRLQLEQEYVSLILHQEMPEPAELARAWAMERERFDRERGQGREQSWRRLRVLDRKPGGGIRGDQLHELARALYAQPDGWRYMLHGAYGPWGPSGSGGGTVRYREENWVAEAGARGFQLDRDEQVVDLFGGVGYLIGHDQPLWFASQLRLGYHKRHTPGSDRIWFVWPQLESGWDYAWRPTLGWESRASLELWPGSTGATALRLRATTGLGWRTVRHLTAAEAAPDQRSQRKGRALSLVAEYEKEGAMSDPRFGLEWSWWVGPREP